MKKEPFNLDKYENDALWRRIKVQPFIPKFGEIENYDVDTLGDDNRDVDTLGEICL